MTAPLCRCWPGCSPVSWRRPPVPRRPSMSPFPRARPIRRPPRLSPPPPALYDGPFDVIDHEYRPVILEAVPSVESGTVRLETASLASGDLYFNPETMLPETLAPGEPYLPPGCPSPRCVRRSEGGQIQMD